MRLAAAFTAALGLTGVLAAPARASEVFVAELHCVGGPYGLKLPSDLRALKAMARVRREHVSEVEPWEGYTATRKTIHFDGLSVGVIEFSNDPSGYMVTSAELTHARWNGLSPFKVGRPTSEAAAVLGVHARDDPALARTYASEGDSVDVRSSNGRVVRVSYGCCSG